MLLIDDDASLLDARRLRKKLLEIDAGFDAIETVIGAGYRLRDG